MKNINFWWVLLVGMLIVLTGVTLRTGNKTALSAILIITGVLTEFISVYFIIKKAVLRRTK